MPRDWSSPGEGARGEEGGLACLEGHTCGLFQTGQVSHLAKGREVKKGGWRRWKHVLRPLPGGPSIFSPGEEEELRDPDLAGARGEGAAGDSAYLSDGQNESVGTCGGAMVGCNCKSCRVFARGWIGRLIEGSIGGSTWGTIGSWV